jgi:hypothetical protein
MREALDELPDPTTLTTLVERGFARIAESEFEDAIGYFDEATARRSFTSSGTRTPPRSATRTWTPLSRSCSSPAGP